MYFSIGDNLNSWGPGINTQYHKNNIKQMNKQQAFQTEIYSYVKQKLNKVNLIVKFDTVYIDKHYFEQDTSLLIYDKHIL